MSIGEQLLAQKSLKALKSIDEAELNKALQRIEKGLRKYPKDPANFFVLAKIYSLPQFSDQLLDSAHYYIIASDSGYSNLSAKLKKKYVRKGMDSLKIIELHTVIDSLAFYRAKQIHTEESYNFYLKNYPESFWEEQAITLRNKAAYEYALQQKTPEALSDFFKLYPNAPQAKEAREVFENLYYQQFTESGIIKSFKDYITERPHTIFAEKAANNLLNLISSAADMVMLREFHQTYPDYSASHQAKDFLDYLPSTTQAIKLLSHFKEGAFHFYNLESEKLEELTLSKIKEDSCKWINEPFLTVPSAKGDVLINIRGDTLFQGVILSEEVFNQQWLKLKEKGSYLFDFIHLSGNDQLRYKGLDFKVINNCFFAEKEGEGWQLKTFTGYSLIEEHVDSIWQDHEVIFFQQGNKFAAITSAKLKKNALKDLPPLAYLYTDYEFMSDSLLRLSSDSYETIVNSQMQTLFDLTKAKISKREVYFILEKEKETEVFDQKYKLLYSGKTDKIKAEGVFLAIKRNERWALQNWAEKSTPDFKYDSIRIFNSWLAYAQDSVKEYLVFNKFSKYPIQKKTSFKILRSQSTLQGQNKPYMLLLITDEKNHQSLLNPEMKLVWQGESDEIRVVSSDLVYIKLGKKQFLLNSNGQQFPLENIQAIGNAENGNIPILNKGKFGVYLAQTHQIIAPQSETKMLIFKPDSIFIFQQAGKYGLLNTQEELIKPLYQQILAVNDSLALVHDFNNWQLINIYKPEEIIDSYSFVEKVVLNGEKLFEVRKPNGFGLLDTAGKLKLPAMFNSLSHVIISNKTYWIAERDLAEISFKVLAYFNEYGTLLYRVGLTTDEFDRHSCD